MTDHGLNINELPAWDEELLVEQISDELGEAIPRPLIRQVLAEVAPKFESARIKNLRPNFHSQAGAHAAASWTGERHKLSYPNRVPELRRMRDEPTIKG